VLDRLSKSIWTPTEDIEQALEEGE
jgi:hypothetical protein